MTKIKGMAIGNIIADNKNSVMINVRQNGLWCFIFLSWKIYVDMLFVLLWNTKLHSCTISHHVQFLIMLAISYYDNVMVVKCLPLKGPSAELPWIFLAIVKHENYDWKGEIFTQLPLNIILLCYVDDKSVLVLVNDLVSNRKEEVIICINDDPDFRHIFV